jgi:adenosylcobinamide kinase/adenosylcobinamide-phosphate guanylyltransferase
MRKNGRGRDAAVVVFDARTIYFSEAMLRIFISGGCKNGKSTLAQRIAVSQNCGAGLYYVATMVSTGREDDRRIARHRAERAGDGFTTIELATGISGLTGLCNSGSSILLDSLTALLQNEMFQGDFTDFDAAVRVLPELRQTIGFFENIVIVSDFIYSDAQIYDEGTERYRESLALLDRAAAESCDTVLEVVKASVITHKGELAL